MIVKIIKQKVKYAIPKIFPSSAIMMFHHITGEPESLKSCCVLDYNNFLEVLDTFERYASISEVCNSPRKNKIAITFDDGLLDVYSLAYPVLKEKNIPFTVFIISDFVGTEGYITVEQLKELANDPLVTIGSHGTSHGILTEMSFEEQKEELTISKKKIEEWIGKKVDFFAYSHGIFNSDTVKLTNEIYDFSFSTRAFPVNLLTKSRHNIPRYDLQNRNYKTVVATLKSYIRKKNNVN